MSVKNIVKVMNFHALLRVNEARKKVEQATKYEEELKYIISTVVNNRIFKQDRVSLALNKDAKELNIYIGSDLGFCANFNADVMSYLRTDDDRNDKIIIGKRVHLNCENVVYYTDREKLDANSGEIFEIVLNGVLARAYSKINIIYIHYYGLSQQEITKKTILPFDQDDMEDDVEKKGLRRVGHKEDFVAEGDVNYIIWNLISVYVSMEIKVAEAWSYASENVQRQAFTNESLKKIEENEENALKEARKAKHAKAFKVIVEMNNKKMREKGRKSE